MLSGFIVFEFMKRGLFLGDYYVNCHCYVRLLVSDGNVFFFSVMYDQSSLKCGFVCGPKAF